MDWMVSGRAHPFDIVFVRLSNFAPLYFFRPSLQTKGTADRSRRPEPATLRQHPTG